MSDKILGGRYKIISPLGSGGFGETYLAEDTQYPGHPHCVVKKLKPQLEQPDIWSDACRLFQQEAQILSRLGQHAQIPQLLAHFEEDQHFFLVQELIEGSDLSHELAVGQQNSEYFTTLLLKDILEVLEFVHQQGVIHRDIKPSNLIRRRSDGKVVLIDFGAVKAIGLQTTVANGNTAHTISVCTPGYSPNEQLSGQPKLASDIYAVGMIGIQSLTGKSPADLPKDPNTGEILWNENIQVSPQLASLLNQMVLYDFRQRPQDASRAKQALLALHHSPTAISTPTPSPLPPTEKVTQVQEVANPQSTSSASEIVKPAKSRRGRLPIRTFFAALLLGIFGGSGGTIYVIQRFFPSMLKLVDNPPPQEQPLAVGGVDELQPRRSQNEDQVRDENGASENSPSSDLQQLDASQPETEIDYTPLAKSLQAKQWKNSDQITRDIMLRLTGRVGSSLRIEDIETIPCNDFNQLDQLWSAASQERFGFKAQQLAWQKIAGKAAENVPQSNAKNASAEFLLQTLWSYKYFGSDRLYEYQNLIFSINAPVGHLPAKAYIQTSKVIDTTPLEGVSELLPTIAQRSAICIQSPQPID